MLKKLKRFSVLFFVFALVFFLPSVSQVLGDKSEAISMVSRAEDSLEAAYLSVLEAERAGGEILELVEDLNNALEYLSGAERTFERGDYDRAVLLSRKAFEESKVIIDGATVLQSVAKDHSTRIFMNRSILSVLTVFSIVLLGFLGWSLFKDYYIRRLMGMRLEVAKDESR